MNSTLEFSSAWHHVQSGEHSVMWHGVSSRADGGEIALPMVVVCGKKPGKTLLVTAGVHGDEFEGMAALHQIAHQLDPAMLRGTFVAVPVANPPAYEAGLRTNPDDRQDLARVFPGDPQGTVTEQIAHALTHRFIRHADFYCDLHSAGQYYAIEPWSGYQMRSELLEPQRQAARLFGLPTVWGTPGLPGRSLSVAAEHGVPSIYAEVTGEGRCRTEDVDRHTFGVRQLLAWLEITPEPPQATQPLRVVEDDRPNAGYLQVQCRAPSGGFFRPAVGLGDEVGAGDAMGDILDPAGKVLHTPKTAVSGRVVFLRTFSRVLSGDPLGTVMELP